MGHSVDNLHHSQDVLTIKRRYHFIKQNIDRYGDSAVLVFIGYSLNATLNATFFVNSFTWLASIGQSTLWPKLKASLCGGVGF